LKKATAFSGPGNDSDNDLFIPAKGAIIESCDCGIRAIIPKAFLTTDVPMVIRPGEKVNFARITIKEIGWLLQKIANLRGMGVLAVSQNADKMELLVTEWTAFRQKLVESIDRLLKDVFGFHFIKRESHCQKCGDACFLSESLIRMPCGRTAAAAKAKLGPAFAVICKDCERRYALSEAIFYRDNFDAIASIEMIKYILSEMGINPRRSIAVAGNFAFFGPGE